jgi:three-Cys-motif partner protein
MARFPQTFGGSWTDKKLERVRKYLVAYATIMSKQHFRFAYIDAFAGTGYRTLEHEQTSLAKSFPEIFDEESRRFLDGSASIALQVKPRFNKYIFIERDKERVLELEKLRTKFPELQDDIIVEQAEANSFLQKLCTRNWTSRRAVLFLDPFGMQVTWATVTAIAGTEAIDLWILFPISAVNRLLTRSAKINSSWRARLDEMFGSSDWYDAFYRTNTTTDIFGDEEIDTVKLADFELIARYFVRRLKTVFVGVAENPLPLLNSRNTPLYLLCFASGNAKGSKTAIKIAQDILKR